MNRVVSFPILLALLALTAAPLSAADGTLRLAAPPQPDFDAGNADRLSRITQQPDPSFTPRIIVAQPLRATPQEKARLAQRPTLIASLTQTAATLVAQPAPSPEPTFRIITRSDGSRITQPIVTMYGSTSGVQTVRNPQADQPDPKVYLPPAIAQVPANPPQDNPNQSSPRDSSPPPTSVPSIAWNTIRAQNAAEVDYRFPRIEVRQRGNWVYYADPYGNPSIPVRVVDGFVIGDSNGYFRQVRYSTYLHPYAFVVPPGWSPPPERHPGWGYWGYPRHWHAHGSYFSLRINF